MKSKIEYIIEYTKAKLNEIEELYTETRKTIPVKSEELKMLETDMRIEGLK